MKQTTLRYRALRRVRSLPAETASRLLGMPAVSRRLNKAYEKARASHRPRLPRLTSRDMDIVAGLENDGVSITSLAALDMPGTDTLWTSATGTQTPIPPVPKRVSSPANIRCRSAPRI